MLVVLDRSYHLYTAIVHVLYNCYNGRALDIPASENFHMVIGVSETLDADSPEHTYIGRC